MPGVKDIVSSEADGHSAGATPFPLLAPVQNRPAPGCQAQPQSNQACGRQESSLKPLKSRRLNPESRRIQPFSRLIKANQGFLREKIPALINLDQGNSSPRCPDVIMPRFNAHRLTSVKIGEHRLPRPPIDAAQRPPLGAVADHWLAVTQPPASFGCLRQAGQCQDAPPPDVT